MKILFVCEMNHQRSPTFEKWFREHTTHSVRSCGTLFGSEVEISEDLLDQADEVYTMDLKQELEIKNNFNKFSYKVTTIGVSDEYARDSPQLNRIIAYWAKREKLI